LSTTSETDVVEVDNDVVGGRASDHRVEGVTESKVNGLAETAERMKEDTTKRKGMQDENTRIALAMCVFSRQGLTR